MHLEYDHEKKQKHFVPHNISLSNMHTALALWCLVIGWWWSVLPIFWHIKHFRFHKTLPDINNYYYSQQTWWLDDVESLIASLSLCGVNHSITGGFSSKGDKLLYKQWNNRRFDMPWCSCGVTMYNGFDAASYVYVAVDVINYFKKMLHYKSYTRDFTSYFGGT